MHALSPLRRFLVGSIAALGLSLPGGAFAHAFLDHALPAVGSTVAASPAQLQLWFTEPLEPVFSTVRLFGPDGKEVDKGDKAVSPSDKTLLTVSVPSLPPGTYKVVWQVVSVDTHKTQGDFTFTVKP